MPWEWILDPALSKLQPKGRPKREVRGLAEFAHRHGLRFHDVTVAFGHYEDFCRFSKMGAEWAVEHAITGTWNGMAVAAGDLWTRSYILNKPQEKRYSSIVVAHLAIAVPHVDVTTRTVADKVAGAVMDPLERVLDPIDKLFERADPQYREKQEAYGTGLAPIDLGSPEFHSRFDVTTEDPDFARSLVDSRMREWLAGLEAGFNFELMGRHLLVYSKRRSVEDLAPLFDVATGFPDRIPPAVWRDYGLGERA